MSEVKSLLDIMGSVSMEQSYSQSQSEYDNKYLDDLEAETENLLDDLSLFCDTLNKNYAKLKHDSNEANKKYS